MTVFWLPRRWWFRVSPPYFTVGLWLVSFGRLRTTDLMSVAVAGLKTP